MLHLTSGLAGVLVLLIGAVGCVMVPFPAPTRTRAPGVTHQRIDLGFLKVGATTRADVMREVGDFATDATTDRFVWCRWESSKAAVARIVLGAGTEGERIWVKKNLLAVFDGRGVLTDYRLPADGELTGVLFALFREGRYLPPTEVAPFRLDFRYEKRMWSGSDRNAYGDLEIEQGELRYRVRGKRKVVTAPLHAVREVEIRGMEAGLDVVVRLRVEGSGTLSVGGSAGTAVRLLGVLHRKLGIALPVPN